MHKGSRPRTQSHSHSSYIYINRVGRKQTDLIPIEGEGVLTSGENKSRQGKTYVPNVVYDFLCWPVFSVEIHVHLIFNYFF